MTQVPEQASLLARLSGQLNCPFVGRSEELSRLAGLLAEAGRGDLRLVFVFGEPGAGKSRLCLELMTRAGREGWQTLRGRCFENAGGVLAPFESELLPRLERAGLLKAARGDTDGALLRAAARSKPHASGGPEPEPPDIGAALARKVALLAGRRPVLLVVDDLQWLEGGALSAFHGFALALSDIGRERQAPILVACTVRTQPGESSALHAVDRMRREEFTRLLELGGLGDAEAYALVKELAGMECDAALLEALQAVTRGNPLHLAESLRDLAARGVLEVRGGRLASRGSEESIRVPESATAALRQAISRLPAEVTGALELAALMGEEFRLESLAAAFPSPGLAQALDSAAAQGLIAGDGRTFRFAHGLFRQALLDSIGPVRRLAMHGELFRALSARFGDDPAHTLELAAHLDAAGSNSRPEDGQLFARAGELASDAFAWNLGTRYFERALANEGYVRALDDRECGELQVMAGRAAMRNADGVRARELHRQAMDRFRAVGDHRAWGLALLRWERTFTTVGVWNFDAGPYAEFRESAGDDVPDVRAALLAHWAETRWLARDPADLEAAEAALEVALGTDVAEVQAQALATMGLVRMRRLQPVEAHTAFRSATEAAAAQPNVRIKGWGAARESMPLVMLGRLGEARDAATRSLAEAMAANDWPHSALDLAMLVVIHLLSGEGDAARRRSVEAAMMVTRANYMQAGVILESSVAWDRILRGELDEAPDALASWERSAGRSAVYATRLLLETALHGPEAAHLALESRPLRPATRTSIDFNTLGAACAAVELAEALDSPPIAEPFYEGLEEALTRGVVFSVTPPFLVPRVLATAARLLGRHAEAARLLGQALEVANASGAGPEVAHTHLEWAELLAERNPGNAVELRPHLAQALSIYESLDTGPPADRVRTLARRCGITLGGGLEVGLDELSATEREVLAEYARGLSGEQIAARLLLSERTVLDHLGRLRRRLAIGSGGDAARYLGEQRVAPAADGHPRRSDLPAERGALSPREIEVLQLIALGKTNQQIADELVISLHTVARHVANIFDKTGASNRTEAAHLAAGQQ